MSEDTQNSAASDPSEAGFTPLSPEEKEGFRPDLQPVERLEAPEIVDLAALEGFETLDEQELERVAVVVRTSLDRISPLYGEEFQVFRDILTKESRILARDDLSPNIRVALVGSHQRVKKLLSALIARSNEPLGSPQKKMIPADVVKILGINTSPSSATEVNGSDQDLNDVNSLLEETGAMVDELTLDLQVLEAMDFEQIQRLLHKFDQIKPQLEQLMEQFADEKAGTQSRIMAFGILNLFSRIESLRNKPHSKLNDVPRRLKALISGVWPMDLDKLKKIGSTASSVIHHPLTMYIDPTGELKNRAFECHQFYTSILALNTIYLPTIEENIADLQKEGAFSVDELENFARQITENFRSFANIYVEFLEAEGEDKEALREMIDEMEDEYIDLLAKGFEPD